MNTSYFAHYRGSDGVAITAYKPKFFSGPVYPDLAPSKSLLARYKNGTVSEAGYEAEFREQLTSLDPQRVWNDLHDKVLLCYETADKFCHRHIIAAWIEESLGYKVVEI